MRVHTEEAFEVDIVAHLAENGWLVSQSGSEGFVRGLCLFPEDVIGWVQATQPDPWESLIRNHGSNAADQLLNELRKALDQTGTLNVIRDGFDILGLRSRLKMAEFRPALSINPDIVERYQQNRLRVVRQVRFSKHKEDSIDLVLLLNGIPVATAELKTDYTQSIDDAVKQYKEDRKPKTNSHPEPLLQFRSGAIVHFAVSSSEVRMTTHLRGEDTFFLPFNQGNDGAAGNPTNPNGYATAYLWEEVWERDSWLEILGRYIMAEKDGKKQVRKLIFPRYHQLAASRGLRDRVLEEGPGGKYLIQHSAGSGKTNSIAWTAHFLADLHDEHHRKLFDTVLVVSDRKVIDGQLQEAIHSFERTAGVVVKVTGKKGSKSSELTDALSGDKKILVCTIQTFPHALKMVQELAATQGKRFAVIADEAHSSQTGTAAGKLKEVLAGDGGSDPEDDQAVSTEDILTAQMSARAAEGGITYIAFTATPKAKTLELFGRCPNPNEPASDDNLPEPFHIYSMRQAIEEGFILDVLKNYLSYDVAFKLATEDGEEEVGSSQATRGLMQWVRLHPHNISQKVRIVVEHFREKVAPLLHGTAKAMVVVSSRKEAVRWQLAMNKYIAESGYSLGTLVAFSGEVVDKESGPDAFRESSEALNPGLNQRDIQEAFKDGDFQILLVANKFQTGFDQPLLCGMYIDKRLAGIQAVQTLSRLNRCHPGKSDTYILDFVNQPDEILSAFKTYYTTAELSGLTDKALILQLRNTLDDYGLYDEHEIERVVNVVISDNATQKALDAAVKPPADRITTQYGEAREALREALRASDKRAEQEAKDRMTALELFKRNMGSYVRVYSFLSQIFDYGNTDFEKRAIFYKVLLRLLKFGRDSSDVDLSSVRMTHHRLIKGQERDLGISSKDAPKLRPAGDVGTGMVREEPKALMSEIINQLNELYGEGCGTEGDKMSHAQTLFAKILESNRLRQQAANNSEQQFSSSPDLIPELTNAAIEAMDTQAEMSSQALSSPQILEGLARLFLTRMDLYQELRSRATRA